MKSCFVLVHCDKDMKKAVVDQLRKINGIDEIEELNNEQGIRIKVVAESKDRLRRIIVWKIQKMACVNSVQNLD